MTLGILNKSIYHITSQNMDHLNNAPQEAQGMDRIHNMLVELLPSYTIKRAEACRDDQNLSNKIKAYRAWCTASDKLIYLIHVEANNQYMAQMTGALGRDYYSIFIGKYAVAGPLDVSKEVFSRHIETILKRKETGEGPACTVCSITHGRIIQCNCKYAICWNCIIAKMNAGARACPNCSSVWPMTKVAV